MWVQWGIKSQHLHTSISSASVEPNLEPVNIFKPVKFSGQAQVSLGYPPFRHNRGSQAFHEYDIMDF